jgi:hypothetical protein
LALEHGFQGPYSSYQTHDVLTLEGGETMPTFTNTRGDTVVVTCGGFGGDNVLGTVEEKTGNITVPVKGADVTASNSSKAGEVARLENKFESARAQGGVPPSDMQWAITQEMFELLKKLVFKAFLLQGLKPPPLRPGPEG